MGIRDYSYSSWAPIGQGAVGQGKNDRNSLPAGLVGPHRKPEAVRDFHPTTVPDYEPPFWLNYVPSKHEYYLTRHGDSRTLPCCANKDEVHLGCTYIDNTAIREMYWWSNASPRWLRWIVRMWDAWKRRTSESDNE